METQQVMMTREELIQYEEFKAAKAKKEAEQKKKQEREEYKTLLDETIGNMMPKLAEASEHIAKTKGEAMKDFKTIIDLKSELFDVKSGQQSHTFTHSNGRQRIMIGQYVTDSYRDTVNEGFAKVRQYIESLVKDDDTKNLVKGIMRLLAKDNQGNLKASRVLQLRKMAEESNNEGFIEGVKIIEESYQPQISKTYIRAEIKNEKEEWVSLPLGMTEA